MPGTGQLFGLFFVLCAAGAAGSFAVPERRRPGVLATLGALAALAAIACGVSGLAAPGELDLRLWPLLTLGRLSLRLDGLSSLFIVVTGFVFAPVSIYSGWYLRKYLGTHNLRYFAVLYFGFFAALVLVLAAGDAFSFLLAWELMSVLSYLLVSFEQEREESTRAGFLMLGMSEAGMVAVVLAFAILVNASGTVDFAATRLAAAGLGGGAALAVFLLSFLGFAVKAGLAPLNSWLPRAHPVAPTNVSALLSGVMVNLGIYGIMRVNIGLLPPGGPDRGLLILLVGSLSALIGILYATTQTDLKRMLAHSTIENMGIVTAALGAGMVFAAAGLHVVAGIALIAALYHMLNHALYKALLFLGAGGVEAVAGSRDLDRLGGLVRAMPVTSACVLVGIVAISGLPPSNGFVSEWLILQSILRAAALADTFTKIVFALSGAALALTAGLAVTCFVRAFAMGFLGLARSDGARRARETARPVRVALGMLAGTCVLLGVLPTVVIPVLDRVTSPLIHASATDALVPAFFATSASDGQGLRPAFVDEFRDLGAQTGRSVLPVRGLVVLHQGSARNPVVFAMSTAYMALVLGGLLALTVIVFRLLGRGKSIARLAAWDGGIRVLRPA